MMLKLLAVLTSGIPAIIAAILAFVGRKFGTAAGTIAAFVIMTTAFIACINLILNTLIALMLMPGWVATAIGLFVPYQFSACIAAAVSGRICRAAYDLAMLKAQAINNAS
jgi:hypothetical protein